VGYYIYARSLGDASGCFGIRLYNQGSVGGGVAEQLIVKNKQESVLSLPK
jgi:hypothetical protein